MRYVTPFHSSWASREASTIWSPQQPQMPPLSHFPPSISIRRRLLQLVLAARALTSLRAPSILELFGPVVAFAFSCFPASLIIAVTIAELRVVID